MASTSSVREISDEAWDRKEFDWTGRSFYFVNCTFLLGNAIGLDNKLEQMNRDLRTSGYKVKNPMILVEYGKFKGRVMIEVEKKDQYDAQYHVYDVHTNCDTIVLYGGLSNLKKGVDRLREWVTSRRSMEPRQIFYLYQPDTGVTKTILFGLT
jgi:hypothetical protein